MKILVAGGAGQVGRALVAGAPPHYHVVSKVRSELDINDRAAVDHALAATEADWLINGAAYTAVDVAEKESAQAEAINSTAVAVLAAATAATGCRLLHFSTDFVFDGSSSVAYQPTDARRPLGVYGATKAQGEAHALRNASAIVLRTAWVYAAQGKNFVLTMLKLMRERPEVRVVSDQIGSPTWATGIAGATWACIERAVPGGIYHWTDLGVASWYDFAVAIQEEALERGLLTNAVPVIPIPSAAYPTPAKRPSFSVLDTRSTRDALSLPGTHWRSNLRTMLDELRTT